GDRERRDEDRRHRDRGVLLPGRVARGAGGDVHQHAAPSAVAREGDRAAGRRAQRDPVHGRTRPPAEIDGDGRAARRRAAGDDVPDFTKSKSPKARGSKSKGGDEALPGDAPFIMHPDGLGWLYVPSGLKDGPLPAHYEPLETNLANDLYPSQVRNPAANAMERPDNAYAKSPDERFPHILTTYRLTEHHTAGGMSRTLSHLAELQPELFAEISPELAREAGVANGDVVIVSTARGSIRARALVTTRMPSLDIHTSTGVARVHQVGLPYHWGPRGLVIG